MVFHGCPLRKFGVNRERAGGIFDAGRAAIALPVPAAALPCGNDPENPRQRRAVLRILPELNGIGHVPALIGASGLHCHSGFMPTAFTMRPYFA
jgi:hypothetical protein